MVPIDKPKGHIKVCTDFRDLNVTCPKDDFSLPNINTFIDNTSVYEMLSLMNGFSGYNHIWVAQQDQHKIAFTTSWGRFYYKFIPIKLKNINTTYQCAMMYVFHDIMHNIMEDYVNYFLLCLESKANIGRY